MSTLADKFKSAAVAAFAGATLCFVAATITIRLVARTHHATIGTVARFAYDQPVRYWPYDLTAFAAGSAVAGVLAALGFFVLLKNATWTHRPRRVDSDKAAAELIAKSTPKSPRIFAGKYRGKTMFVSAEDRGLVIGPPGTGKTAFLFNQLLRAMKTGQHFVAIDLKPELHQVLAPSLREAGYRVLRINPAAADSTADHWNPLDDIKLETELAELCAALLPIRDLGEAPFTEAQRDWLKAAVFHMSSTPGGSLPGAFNFLSSSPEPEKIAAILIKSPNLTAARIGRRLAAGMSGKGGEGMILNGFVSALRSLDYLSLAGVQDALGYSDFSVRELGKGDQPIALFLQFEETKLNALGPLLAFMANGVITSLIESATERKPVFLFLDEVGNMPPIPNLLQKLNTMRSRNIPTWMYFQTAQQMEQQYGRGATSTFFASSDFQMVFRLNDHSTRELVSKLIGTTQRERISYSDGGDRTTTTRSLETISVLEPYELGQLEAGQVIALYRGAVAKGNATPYFIDFPKFRRR